MANGAGDCELYIQDCDFDLRVVSWTGKEALSKLYSFEIRITCDEDLSAVATGADSQPDDPPRFLRSRALFRVPYDTGARNVRGIVASIVPEGSTIRDRNNVPHQLWRIRIVPIFWLAKHRIRSRIFQNMNVTEIVTDVLTAQEYGTLGLRVNTTVTDEHPKREYCMQYEESDYAFIKRILSEEGIFWYFDHGSEEPTPSTRFVHDGTRRNWHTVGFDPTSNAEVLVLRDEARYPPLILDPTKADQGPATLRLVDHTNAVVANTLSTFEVNHAVKPNAVLLRDYDYERPHLDVTAAAPLAPGSTGRASEELIAKDDAVEKWWNWDSKSRGEQTNDQGVYDATQAGQNPIAAPRDSRANNERDADDSTRVQLRVYEHHSPLGPKRVDQPLAQERLESYRKNRELASGTGYCPQLTPGYGFTVTSEIRGISGVDGDYVATRVKHQGQAAATTTNLVYENSFEAVHTNVPYRQRQKPKIRREILESATVVGPVGHDIHTDKLGRVKVQFHWDLKGSMDDRSCCWVRVLQPWSGSAFGAQFIPRVGTEVLVSFREGDHDRPVVMGGVYNGAQPLPFLPPEGQTRTGFRTQSVPGGNGYNELSFDDHAGNERVTLRAQSDLDTYVGRDRMTRIEGSEVKQVEKKQTERVTEDVDREIGGNEKVKVFGARMSVVEGMSETTVGEDSYTEIQGAERHLIKRTGFLQAGDDLTTRADGNHATIVGKHDQNRSFALHVEGTSQLHSSGITEIVSPKGLRLRCGTSIVEIMEDQILITADKLMFHAPGVQVELHKEGEFWVDADKQAIIKSNSVKLKGSAAMLKLESKAMLMGRKISLCKPESVAGLEELERDLTIIELKDEQGAPCANQQYILVFADESEQTGFLDENGRAELFLEEGATIRFPGMVDVEQGAAQ